MYAAVRSFAAMLMFLVLFPAFAEPISEKQKETAKAMIESGADYLSVEACQECHENYFNRISHRKRGMAADSGTPVAAQGCETCHGPGEKHIIEISEGEFKKGSLIAFSGDHPSSVDARNAVCQECHQGGKHMHWQASTHESEDVACTSCHVVHKPSVVMERSTQADVCFQCHKNIRAQTYRASSHPIREGKVACSDCHNPHGSAGPAELKQLSINDNCYSCHAEKRGPFLWEHFPVTEDCTLCHKVHGSSHPALLTRQGPQLCQQCHQDTRIAGRTHVRLFLDSDLNSPMSGTARGRFVVGKNCLNCHTQVHGSNHPSGVNLQR